jgi:hypothetical protein
MDIRSPFAQLVSPKMEKLAWEARARITWGEPADSVKDWLRESGADEASAQDIIAICLKERGRSLRLKGLRDLVLGVTSMLLGYGGYVAGVMIADLMERRLYIPGKNPGARVLIVFGTVGFLALLYGFRLAFRGCVRLVQGARTKGADSDVDELSPSGN